MGAAWRNGRLPVPAKAWAPAASRRYLSLSSGSSVVEDAWRRPGEEGEDT